jgi:two-component system, cell cycle sensor histidine kinase and response regulator CckA
MVGHAPRAERATWMRRRERQAVRPQPAATSAAYVTALEAVSDPVLIVDRTGIVLYANPALESALGAAPASFLGQHWSSVAPGETITLRRVLQALAAKRSWQTVVRAQHRDGHTVLLDVTLTRVTDARQRLLHFCAVARAPIADHAADLLETVGRLGAEIAHDFNNQIAVVLNYSFILLRQLPEDSTLREHVRQLQAAAWRASQVAQEMVTFGGRRTSDPEILDLNSVITGLGEVLIHALRENVKLELHRSADLLPIRARLPHLEWLLLELALHARILLGTVGRFVVETWNEDVSTIPPSPNASAGAPAVATTQARGQRYVGLTVRAVPVIDSSGEASLAPIRSPFTASQIPENASALPGAELAVVRANGSISTTREPDGGVTYRVRLPALTQ